MSMINDMVIYTRSFETDAMLEVNRACKEIDSVRGQQFERISVTGAGGTKVFCSYIWAMAGNYFPFEELAARFNFFNWNDPEGVVLLINSERTREVTIVRAK